METGARDTHSATIYFHLAQNILAGTERVITKKDVYFLGADLIKLSALFLLGSNKKNYVTVNE